VGQDPGVPSTNSKVRMEAFSDGVFSIAATLLVLDIALHPPGSPLHQVLEAWPGYLGYAVSFLTIGGAWLGHGAMTRRLDHADSLLLRLNLLLLMAIAFLPFPTKLVAEGLQSASGERIYVTLYGLTLLAIRLLGFALDAYAEREHLFVATTEVEATRLKDRKLLSVVIGYVVAICVGVLIPTVAVVFYFGIAVYLVVPFREVARLLWKRP